MEASIPPATHSMKFLTRDPRPGEMELDHGISSLNAVVSLCYVELINDYIHIVQ